MTVALERLTDGPIPRGGLSRVPIAASLVFHLALLLAVAGLLRGAGVLAPSPLAGAIAVRVVAVAPEKPGAAPATSPAETESPAAPAEMAAAPSEIAPATEQPSPPPPSPIPAPATPIPSVTPRIVTWPTIALPTATPALEMQALPRQSAKATPQPKPRPKAARPAKLAPTAAPTKHLPADALASNVPAASAVPVGAASLPAAAAAGAGDAVPVIADPRFRERPTPPIYPERARRLAQQGEVQIRVLLGLDGDPERIVLWRSSGFDLLDQAALAAVHRWRFAPARRNGDSIRAWVQVPVRFFLN